jgi:hypothetical protein
MCRQRLKFLTELNTFLFQKRRGDDDDAICGQIITAPGGKL